MSGVADDPEGAELLEECFAAWRDFPHAARARIQSVCLPMADVEENAAIVNAIQRHAAVIVQKSLAAGPEVRRGVDGRATSTPRASPGPPPALAEDRSDQQDQGHDRGT